MGKRKQRYIDLPPPQKKTARNLSYSSGFSGRRFFGAIVQNPQVRNAVLSAASKVATSAYNSASSRVSNWMNSPKFRAVPRTPGSTAARRKRSWGSAKGVYRGRFKGKPSKADAKGLIAKSLKNGYHTTKETYGTVVDPHCAYIGHNTMDYKLLARTLSGAIQRKLLEKAGIQVASANVELPLIASGASGPSAFFIIMIFKNNVTGGGVESLYEIPDDKDLKGLVAGNTDLLNYLLGWLLNNGPQVNDELNEIRLYERVANLPIDERRLRCRLDLTKESLTIVVKSQLRIQNRTKGDSATADADADRVDNTPVDGKMYTFKHAHAKLAAKTSTPTLLVRFNAMPENGVVLARGSDNFTETLEEPPNQSIFTNCKGTQRVVLNPGDIKDCRISHVYKGTFSTLMSKLRAKSTTDLGVGVPYYYSYGVPGKMQMVVLEEMIRSITSNEIVLVYERNLEIGCYLRSRNPKYALTTELSVEADNDPPEE